MEGTVGTIRQGTAWRHTVNKGGVFSGRSTSRSGEKGLVQFNDSYIQPYHKGSRGDSTVSREFVFTILSCTGIAVVIAEMVVILILKKSKLAFSMKVLSINFIVSDLLFHLVTGGTSVARFVIPRQTLFQVYIARQFLIGFTSCATFGAVTLMVLERTIAMTWPIFHKTKVTMLRTLIPVAIIWVINIGAYCGLTLMYFFGCDRPADALCSENGSRFHQFGSYMLLQETTISLVLVSVYEAVYVAACSMLAWQVASYMRRQQLRKERKDMKGIDLSSTSTSFININNGTNLSKPTDEDENDTNATSAESFGSLSTISFSSDPMRRVQYPPVVSEPTESFQSIQTRINHTKRSVSAVLLRRTAKAPLLVLAMALLQLIMHLPFVIKLVLTMYQGSGEGIKDWKQYLEITSLCLLQIGTIPSLYVYVLRLKSCKEQVMKMFRCK